MVHTRQEEIFCFHVGRTFPDTIVIGVIQDELPLPVRGSIAVYQVRNPAR